MKIFKKEMRKRRGTVLTVVTAMLLGMLLLTGCGGKEGAQKSETGQGSGSAQENENAQGSGSAQENETAQENGNAQENAASREAASGNPEDLHYAEITVKDYGTIRVALDAGAAPKTVENFINLAKSGFYDGLTFHRIMDGFMIQGGDPNGNGTGGSDETIEGEFASNGFDNPISHEKGTISMARAQDPDSASSQFFITVADATFLDGDYAAFGWVTEGMEIAEQIAKDAEPVDQNGTIPPEDQPVIESIRITE